MASDETLNAATVSALEAALLLLPDRIEGEVILPADPAYDAARRILTATFDRHPAAVVRPVSARDVVTAVSFARELGLDIAVRSGGHSPAGFSTCDAGLVIDFSLMKDIAYDAEAGTVRIEAGCLWSEVAAALHPHGLAISSGDFGSVGVGGLTTGGGLGWMVRKVGLTVDHLIGAEVVLADGTLVHASEEANADLFWAIRGGGGNFGVVVSFLFRPHPAGMITGGAVIYDGADLPAVIRGFADYAATAPDELTAMLNIMHAPPLPFLPPQRYGSLVAMLEVCCTGSPEEAARIVAPLRSLATPLADIIGPMPYPAMFAFTEHALPDNAYIHIRSGFAERIDDDFVTSLAEWTGRYPSPGSIVQLRGLGGEMARKEAGSTAFSHRDKPYMVASITIWTEKDQSDTHEAFGENFWQAIAPYHSGVYVGFLGEEGEERARSAYSEETYRRLAQIKARYDPENLFHLNHNIQPAAGD